MSDPAEAPCWPDDCGGDEQIWHIVSTQGNCGSGESTLSEQLDASNIKKKKKKKKKLAQIWVKLWILLVEDITLIVFRKDN